MLAVELPSSAQGPYTPWEMAAWAASASPARRSGAVSRGHVGRVPLALGGALAALAAKEIMNVYEWTIGASHTPAALLAVASVSLPYDLTEMVASLLFGLLFGLELARVLERARTRMEVRFEPATQPPARTP